MTEKREDEVGVKDSEPTEEVGPEECAPKALDCEEKAFAGEAPEGLHPSFMEEISEAYQPEIEILVPSPIDGLPVPMNEGFEPAVAPPFTIDNVVCVEDDRTWVEIERKLLDIVFESSRVELREGVAHVTLTNEEQDYFYHNYVFGSESDKSALPTHVDRNAPELRFMRVVPVRARCEYYKRQVFNLDGEKDHRIVFRNCTIRRSVGGAFMSVRDEAIYACDYRSPSDPISTKKYLDDPDRAKLLSNDHNVKLDLFRKA